MVKKKLVPILINSVWFCFFVFFTRCLYVISIRMVLDDQMCLEKENNENSLSIKLSGVAKELKSGVRCLIRQISGLPLNFREV